MAKDKYVALCPWMVKDLGLKGSELIAYALIYGVEQNCGQYYGSAEYLASVWLGIAPKQGYRVLNSLINKGLLKKWTENGKIYYSAIVPEIEENFAKKGKNGLKTRPYNIIDNIEDNIDNIDNNNIVINSQNKTEQNSSSKTQPSIYKGTTEELCLFADSRFAKFEDYITQFNSPEYENIDMYYYWQVIMDWSNSGTKKKRDWIATTRNWIRTDKDNGKLHLKQKMGVALDPNAIHYLEMSGGLFDE